MRIEQMKTQFCKKVCQLRASEKLTVETLSLESGIPLKRLEPLEQNILPEEMMVDDAFALARVFDRKVHELFE